MNNLLFPTDFSVTTDAPLAWARLFAKKTGATITLLHVYQPIVPDTTLPSIADPGAGIGVGAPVTMELEDISRRNLDELATRLQAEGFPVQSDWRVGSVEDEIIDAAKQYNADLIVMGRTDVSTFFDRLSGSSVSDVVDKVRCPVLVVPTPDQDADNVTYPVDVKSIAYAMQPQTQQSDVARQTGSLVDAFDATLMILTEEQMEHTLADLIVMELYPQTGFIDKLLHPNRTTALIAKSDVPVLIYHQPE
ncbi:MAG: universal stress protein [Oxalobacteraceae bacterium]|nr:MAG: universal stress protein [Oxalobacteraceae bacterium]